MYKDKFPKASNRAKNTCIECLSFETQLSNPTHQITDSSPWTQRLNWKGQQIGLVSVRMEKIVAKEIFGFDNFLFSTSPCIPIQQYYNNTTPLFEHLRTKSWFEILCKSIISFWTCWHSLDWDSDEFRYHNTTLSIADFVGAGLCFTIARIHLQSGRGGKLVTATRAGLTKKGASARWG